MRSGLLVLLEDHSAVAVYQYLMLEVLPLGVVQDKLLILVPQVHQVLHSVAVGDVGDVLVDRGPGIRSLESSGSLFGWHICLPIIILDIP